MNSHFRTLLRLLLLISGCLVLCSPAISRAEMVVVVNPQSGIDQLSKSQVINIFLGHHREFPNGQPAIPADLAPSNSEKSQFYRLLVNKDLDQLAAYWARLVFAGNTQPPIQMSSVQDEIQFVANNKSAIAYMDKRHVDPRVKVVLVLQ